MGFRNVIVVGLAAAAGLVAVAGAGADREEATRPALDAPLRRPVALALVDHDRQLLVANQRSGTITTIDTQSQRVVSEATVGGRISDLTAVHEDRFLLATDRQADQLVVMQREGSGVQVITRLKIASDPVQIISLGDAAGDQTRCAVASRWARHLSLVSVTATGVVRVDHVVELSFAPQAMCQLTTDTLLVADAFGGQLATVDLQRGVVLHVRELFAHNIRGIALSADHKSILLAHQMLHRDAYTTKGGVHWGGVMSNVIRSVPLDVILRNEPLPARDTYFLGTPDEATGDPSDLIVTRDGRQIVAYAGISQVGVSDVGANYFAQVQVGRRPTAIAIDDAQSRLYVANTFDDSISMISLSPLVARARISLGPQRKLTSAERGEQLFYDSRLSSDGWFSCHSCHTDGHSNGFRSDNLSDGSFGAPKRVLSLLGVADSGPWGWNGQTDSLEAQIRKSVAVTMRGPAPTDEQIADLAAYLGTLKPAPPLATARAMPTNASQLVRGRGLFDKHGCADCHNPETYTSAAAYDVKLEDEVGNHQFNPPSLRGVSQRHRLFHDNRATDVADVLRRFQHGVEQPLSPDEVADMVNYLKTL